MDRWSNPGASQQQLLRSDRSMLTMSDDNVMMKQIVATHAPDGRDVDVKPLLHLVEDILNRATMHIDTTAMDTKSQVESIEDKDHQANINAMIDAVAYTIDRISSEIAYKSLGGSDAHATTHSLFNMLSSFSWDAKLVLTLAAFALNYGEFWLLAQIYSSNKLANSMAILKQLPFILEHSGSLKPRFEALNSLIKVMMNVTRCVVEFKELPPMYIAPDVPAMSTVMNIIPTAVYWTIRSVVACASQIASLTGMGHEYVVSTQEAWELSTLAHKLNNIYEHLKKQLDICYQHIDEKRNMESFQMLVKLFDMIHIDNMKVLKALIYSKDDQLPLIDGSTNRRVGLDVLRRKNVLLLISGLNISQDELSILEQIYNESRHHATRLDSQYEVVWIPIVDRDIPWDDSMERKFETLHSTMQWYIVHRPLLIEPAVVRFIQEIWHFRNKPILVVLDPQGRVASPNALHMMWIWGSSAFPFTSHREEALWKEERWRLELLVDGIDPVIINWIKDGKYIILYGGDDIEWVRKFTSNARSVALSERIPLEMVYVGKSTKREQVKRVISTIIAEKLSHCWHDMTMIWFFWTRLESMLFSKIQLGKADENDPMMQEIKKILSYDKEGGWAVLAKGPDVLVNGHSTTFLPALVEYESWKMNVPHRGFDSAFKDHHTKIHAVANPCCKFEFPSSTGKNPENMKCPECHCVMEKFLTFVCCHGGVPKLT